jgi:hypothetical protein
MSAKAHADDGTDHEITNFDRFHGKLAEKLHTLQRATPDNYEMSAEVSSERYGSVAVVIDSEDSLFNEGEIGDMYFHIILGPQGGLRLASYDRTLGDRGDHVDECDTKDRAWRRLQRAIERAK